METIEQKAKKLRKAFMDGPSRDLYPSEEWFEQGYIMGYSEREAVLVNKACSWLVGKFGCNPEGVKQADELKKYLMSD